MATWKNEIKKITATNYNIAEFKSAMNIGFKTYIIIPIRHWQSGYWNNKYNREQSRF